MRIIQPGYAMRRFRPGLERVEERVAPTTVFILNGNGFAAASPGFQTQNAANLLAARDIRPIQLSTPQMSDSSAFYALADQILAISKGRPISLIGFSAGGAEALRLAALPELNVKDVLNFYGPPDLRDWLATHKGDTHYQNVTANTHFDASILNTMSGPATTSAYIVNAWGLRDTTVVASTSVYDFRTDFPAGKIYYYDGGHGVTVRAQPAAFTDFLQHLP